MQLVTINRRIFNTGCKVLSSTEKSNVNYLVGCMTIQIPTTPILKIMFLISHISKSIKFFLLDKKAVVDLLIKILVLKNTVQ